MKEERERDSKEFSEEEVEKFILSPLKEMWIIWLLVLAEFKRLQRSVPLVLAFGLCSGAVL